MFVSGKEAEYRRGLNPNHPQNQRQYGADIRVRGAKLLAATVLLSIGIVSLRKASEHTSSDAEIFTSTGDIPNAAMVDLNGTADANSLSRQDILGAVGLVTTIAGIAATAGAAAKLRKTTVSRRNLITLFSHRSPNNSI